MDDIGDDITLSGDRQGYLAFRGLLGDLTPAVALYLAVVVVASSVTAVALVISAVPYGDLPAVIALACISTLGERGRIQLSGRLTVSISLLPALFAAALFGPLAGMIVYAPSVTGLAFPWTGRLAYASSRALTGAAAGGVALLVNDAMHGGVSSAVASAFVAALVAEVSDSGFACLTFWLRGNGPVTRAGRDLMPVIAASVPFYGATVALLVLAYREVSPWTLPLFFAPAIAAQRFFALYRQQRQFATDLSLSNARLEAANLSFATALVATLDARDRYTAGHSAAVAVYARDIAARMGLPEHDQELAHLSGLVHDIGKIGLPAGLLEKPGALTLDERRAMQTHSEIGYGILSKVDTYEDVAAIVRSHHERVDGNGYPDGLKGEAIPLLARIVAVADAYNAMTSHRPYREAMKSRVARLRLAQAADTQFDTTVLAAFEAILAGAGENYRTADEAGFFIAPAVPPRGDDRPPTYVQSA